MSITIALSYKKRTYGTSEDFPVSGYRLCVSSGTRAVSVKFDFPISELGRGYGEGAGELQSLAISLPKDDAAAFAGALLEAISQRSSSKELFFGEDSKENREFIRMVHEAMKRDPSLSFFAAARKIAQIDDQCLDKKKRSD